MSTTDAAPAASRPAGSDLPRPDRFKPRGTVKGSKRGRIRAVVLLLVHVAAAIHIAQWLADGSTVSPIEPSETEEALDTGGVNAGMVFFGLAILSALLLGRWICGWACHFVAYQDACAWLLGRVGLRPRPVRARLLILAPAVVAFFMFAWPVLDRWLVGEPAPEWQAALTTTEFWRKFPGLWMALITIAVDGFLLVWWLGAKGFCTFGCPYGAVFGAVEPLAMGRILVNDDCETCGHCTAVCTSNVLVHKEVAQHGMVIDPGCMKCMDCVSACPKDALRYGFAKPRPVSRGRALLTRWRKQQADFSWGEELLMVTVWAATTYFVYRGLFGYVSLLLAVGLGVIAAITLVLGWRLVTRRDLSLQGRPLKVGGSLKTAGLVAAVVVVTWLGFTGYAAWLTREIRMGRELAQTTLAGGFTPPEARSRLDESVAHLETALAATPVEDVGLHTLLGLVERERGRFDPTHFTAAEHHLRIAYRNEPDPRVIIPLTDVLAMRGAFDEAEPLLREVLERFPDYAPAMQRLEMLEAQRQQGR